MIILWLSYDYLMIIYWIPYDHLTSTWWSPNVNNTSITNDNKNGATCSCMPYSYISETNNSQWSWLCVFYNIPPLHMPLPKTHTPPACVHHGIPLKFRTCFWTSYLVTNSWLMNDRQQTTDRLILFLVFFQSLCLSWLLRRWWKLCHNSYQVQRNRNR